MDITNQFVQAIGAHTVKRSNEIVACFVNGRRVKYTIAIMGMLKTDPSVIEIASADTGEIIWNRVK